MTIFHIPFTEIKKNDFDSLSLNDEVLTTFSKIENFDSAIKKIRCGVADLQNIPTEILLDFFDSFALSLLANDEILDWFSTIGITFIINFMRKENLKKLLNESMHGDFNFLDGFCDVGNLGKKMMAHPKGVITHWLAGNVPALGMISLVQGLITKNANVVKLPRENGLVLPVLLSHMSLHLYNKGSITLRGNQVLGPCLLVYCDRNATAAQNNLSVNSDVRVAWGGREAVESVMSLPKKYGTDDLIMGPKYSFAVIARNSFDASQVRTVCHKVAMDASVFEQQGCNSPHTIFVEQGGEVSPIDFAKKLGESMEDVLKRVPKSPISSGDAYSLVNMRSTYSFTGQVFASKGTEWTVIYSEEEGLAKPCYFRTLFVRPVENITDVLPLIEHKKHQTLGLSIQSADKVQFAIQATRSGIERITDIGKMSVYDNPWDGLFPMEKFVRWSSCPL